MKLKDFFQAVRDGNLSEVKRGIQEGIDPSTKNEDQLTALDIACQLDHQALIDYLINLPEQTPAASHASPTDNDDDTVCIIGYSSVFPQSGTTPEEFWHTLCQGQSAITEVPDDRWPVADYYDPDKKAPGKMYTKQGGFISGSPYAFDASFFNVVPKEAEVMDPQQRLMLEGVWYAMEHAGINPATLKGKAVGVYCGIMTHDYTDMIIDGQIEHNNFIATGNSASVLSGRVSYFYGFQGPAMTIDTACSSSLVTTHAAHDALRLGQCDIAFSAGVNTMLAPGVTINCCKAGMLAVDGTSKTFSAAADGYGRGEGCGVLVMKRLKDAKRDGNRIYGIIRASAVNQDGASSGLTVPNKQAQVNVIARTHALSGLTPDDIDYIEAHGTGTLTGDPIEINALKEVFSNRSSAIEKLAVSSVKATIGHTEAAAGVAGIIKVLLALEHETIPALPIVGAVNPKIKVADSHLQLLQGHHAWQRRAERPRRAGISSFGFSGTNAHLILEEAPAITNDEEQELARQWQSHTQLPIPMQASQDSAWQVLTLSAKTSAALTAVIAQYQTRLAAIGKDHTAWLDLVYSVQTTRQHFAHRVAVIADSAASCLQALAKITPGEKYAGSSITFYVPALAQIDLGSYQARYQTDAMYRSLFKSLQQQITSEDYQAAEAIMLGKMQTETAMATFLAVYAYYLRLQQMNLVPVQISHHADSAILAACLDEQYSLKDALLLLKGKNNEVVSQPGQGRLTTAKHAQDCTVNLQDAQQATLLQTLAAAYQQGQNIDWGNYWTGSLRTRIACPQYPFQRQMYRIPTLQSKPAKLAEKVASVDHTASYALDWQTPDSTPTTFALQQRTSLLIKVTNQQLLDAMSQTALRALPIKWLIAGERGHHEIGLQIRFDQAEDWLWLQNEMQEAGITHFIDLSLLDVQHLAAHVSSPSLETALTQRLMENHQCLFSFVQAKQNIDMWVALPSERQTLDRRINMLLASIEGQCASVTLATGQLTQLLLPSDITAACAALQQLPANLAERVWRWQVSGWQVQRLLPVTLPPTPHDIFKKNDVILITGGLGALGLTLAKWLVAQQVAEVILLGRRPPNAEQQQQLLSLQQGQTKITLKQVDIANQAALLTVLRDIAATTTITQVYHLAGAPAIKRFDKLTADDYRLSLSAKALGAYHLETALQQLNIIPHQMVYFSSSASIFPEAGQTAYAAANRVLDQLAADAVAMPYPIKVINWGLWGAAGFGADAEARKRVRAGTGTLSESACQAALSAILAAPALRQISVFNIDWSVYRKHLSISERLLIAKLHAVAEAAASPAPQHEELLALPDTERLTRIQHLLRAIIHDETGLTIDDDKIQSEFEAELGFESITMNAIQERIQAALGDENKPYAATLLFDNNTFEKLALYINQQFTPASPTDYIRTLVTAQTSRVKMVTLKKNTQDDEPPLVFIHTIMGSVFFYRALVDHLPYGGTIYGVDDPYFSNLSEKFTSIEDMAAAYAKALQSEFGNRAIRLAGLSFAGAVAYEVAQQLITLGAKVDSVLMFDTAMPGAGDLTLPDSQRQYVMGEVSADIDAYYQATINNNQRILNAYRPRAPQDDLRVILFKARSRDSVNVSLPSLNLSCNGWLDLFCPEVISVPGSHFSLFDRAYLQTTVNAIRYVYGLRDYFIDVEKRADVSVNRHKLFLQAAANGDAYLVLRCLQEKVDPLIIDRHGRHAAMYAAENDDLTSLAWIHYFAGQRLIIPSLYESAISGHSLKTMSYCVSAASMTGEIPMPDITLTSDTNKKQEAIFNPPKKPFAHREWMQILDAHNASRKTTSDVTGPMQILPPVKPPAVQTSDDITHIQCGPQLRTDVVTAYRRGREGERPLFLMHAASGLALPYSALDDLGVGTVYGISNPYFGKEQSFTSIDAMARDYIKRIKAIQPTGPYQLGGWSLGGIVAAHMASLLVAAGEEVAYVLMIDSVNHAGKPYDVECERAAIEHILAQNEAVNRTPGLRAAITRCYLDTSHLLHEYVAPSFNGKIVLLKAEEHETNHDKDPAALTAWRRGLLQDAFTGWGDTFPCLEVMSIKGTHNALFDKECITGVQNALKQYITTVKIADHHLNLATRWCMNLLKSLRRQDERMVQLLMQQPGKDYRYRDERGNLLDELQMQQREDLFLCLDKPALAALRTTQGSTAADVALELSLFDAFDELNNLLTVSTATFGLFAKEEAKQSVPSGPRLH